MSTFKEIVGKIERELLGSPTRTSQAAWRTSFPISSLSTSEKPGHFKTICDKSRAILRKRGTERRATTRTPSGTRTSSRR